MVFLTLSVQMRQELRINPPGFYVGWDVVEHASTSSRHRNRYVNETDLFETSLQCFIGT